MFEQINPISVYYTIKYYENVFKTKELFFPVCSTQLKLIREMDNLTVLSL
jgi:hypothetical protein